MSPFPRVRGPAAVSGRVAPVSRPASKPQSDGDLVLLCHMSHGVSHINQISAESSMSHIQTELHHKIKCSVFHMALHMSAPQSIGIKCFWRFSAMGSQCLKLHNQSIVFFRWEPSNPPPLPSFLYFHSHNPPGVAKRFPVQNPLCSSQTGKQND